MVQKWNQAKTQERHLRCAKAALKAGYSFALAQQDGQVEAVEALVRAHIHGVGEDWTVPQGSGVAVALDRDKNVAGGIVVELMESRGQQIAFLKHVVIAPDHRQEGLGVVLVGIAHQIVEPLYGTKSTYWLGQCEPGQADFYTRSGFTVMDPGQPATNVPGFGRGVEVLNGNDYYTCWFYRTTKPSTRR